MTALTVDTTEVSGWFDGHGEWILYPSRSWEEYYPFVENENAKCVSLINHTGLPRRDFDIMQGKRVVAIGKTIEYDNLGYGMSPTERALSQRTYNGQVVHNFCLRDFVFVVTELKRQ